MDRRDIYVPSHVVDGMRGGRSLRDGYSRGMTVCDPVGIRRCLNDEHFTEAARFISGMTVLRPVDLANLFLIVKFYLPEIVASDARIVEFGVARGGSLLFMASLAKRLLPDVRLIGFDTFSGIPEGEPDVEADWHRSGDFDESGHFVRLSELADELGNVRLVKGEFRNTITELEGPIALCHVDCDTREGVSLAFEMTRSYMAHGGYWVFDDPLHASCLGAMGAVEDHVIRGAGLSCEQAFPHLVFRAP